MRTLGITVLVVCLSPSARGASPYETSAADAAALVGLTMTFGALSWVRHQRAFVSTCEQGACDEKRLLVLDRYAVGKQSESWRWASDIAEAGGVVLPFAAAALDVGLCDDTWSSLGRDAVVMAEAMLVSGALNNLAKLAIPVPRPRQYRAETYKAVAQSEQSFPCGHCVAVSTGATAYAVTYWHRHPDSAARFAVAGLGAVFAGLGSWARVEAGQHFPSDVMAGVGLGLLSGFLVPYLHLRQGLQLTVVPGGVGISGEL